MDMRDLNKNVKTGDPCPCCGQRIKTTDPEALELLTYIRDGRYNLDALVSFIRKRNATSETEATNDRH